MKQGLPTYNVYTFNSMAGETVKLVATSVSTSVTFTFLASKLNYDCIVTNAGTKTAYIAFGTSVVQATVAGATGAMNCTPILSGAIYTFQKNSDFIQSDTCAAICAGGESATLYFTSVQGS